MTTWLPDPGRADRWFGDAAAFARAFRQRFGFDADYHAASAAADVETYAVALARAGSLDPAVVRDAIAVVDFDSLYARIRYGDNGQIVLPQVVVQIQDGAVVPVYASDFLDKPIYPTPAWTARR